MRATIKPSGPFQPIMSYGSFEQDGWTFSIFQRADGWSAEAVTPDYSITLRDGSNRAQTQEQAEIAALHLRDVWQAGLDAIAKQTDAIRVAAMVDA